MPKVKLANLLAEQDGTAGASRIMDTVLGDMKRAHMTQEQLAQAIGMSPQTFSRRAKTGTFRMPELVRISKVLKKNIIIQG